MRKLTPYGLHVLVYYKAYFESTGELPSMNQTSRDLGISYLKVRSSLAHIHLTVKDNNFYSFINDKASRAYSTVSNNDIRKDRKGLEGKTIWNEILSQVQEAYKKRIPSGFYWKTQSWLNNLIKSVGKESLPEYTKWWISEKAEVVDGFNAGIFCCDSMIEEFKRTKKSRKHIESRKRIEKKDFKKDSEKEDFKLLDKILIKIQEKQDLNIYDKRCIAYLKKKGLFHD